MSKRRIAPPLPRKNAGEGISAIAARRCCAAAASLGILERGRFRGVARSVSLNLCPLRSRNISHRTHDVVAEQPPSTHFNHQVIAMSDIRNNPFGFARPSTLDGAPWSRRNFPPCILCIFGGAGDLSHRKLLPALYNLMVDKLLPERFAIVAFSIEDLDNEKYRAFARDGIEKFSRQKITDESWSKFAPMLRYVRGSFTNSADYAKLRKRLEEIDQEVGT